MSHELLHDLAKDVHRLVSAGGSSAAGDEGLRRRAKSLRDLGQKVPVMAQLADAVDKVTNAEPKQATRGLLDLLPVVRQVLAGIATAGGDGNLEPIPQQGPWQTSAPVRDVYSLIESLGSSGTGRLELLKDSVARGVTKDLRLLDSFLEALDDGFGELADFVAETALPAFGPAIVPEVQGKLDLKGGRADARRLVAICKLDAKAAPDLCRKALAEGSPTVRIQALASLADFDPAAAEKAALEVLGQKSIADVRKAAVSALRFARSDAALEALLAALATSEAHEAISSLGHLAHARATARLVEELQGCTFEPAPKGKSKGTAKASKSTAASSAEERAESLILALQLRRDAKACPALLAVLSQSSTRLREVAAQALIVIADPKSIETVADLVDDPKLWKEGINAAWLLPAKACFDRLSPLCADLSDAKKPKREHCGYVLEKFEAEATSKQASRGWDTRWGKLLLAHLDGPSRPGVAIALEVVQGAKAVPRLLKALEASVKKGECGVVEALGRLRVREAVPMFMKLLPGLQSHHYCIHDALRLIGDTTVLPTLQEVLGKAKDWQRKHFLERLIQDLEKAASK